MGSFLDFFLKNKSQIKKVKKDSIIFLKNLSWFIFLLNSSMASKFKWHLDLGCFHDLTSCHLVIKREGKCFISYVGWLINILKKSIIYVTPFIFSTIRL